MEGFIAPFTAELRDRAALLRDHGAAEAIGLRRAICAQPAGKDAGAAFNLARARASEALAGACGSLRPGPATRREP